MKASRRYRSKMVMLVALVALIAGLLGTVSVARANNGVSTQMAICLDGSGSIDATEWALMKDGLTAAVGDPTVIPQDGSVELSIVQFSGGITGGARVELPPTVIDATTVAGVIATINGIVQGGATTPLAAGINLAASQITGSANFPTATWQVINISTNGNPNVPSDARAAAETAVANAVAAGIDEVDVEGIGTDAATVQWMADDLVYPDGAGGDSGAIIPPDSYPPRPPSPDFMGFVRVVETFEQYAEAIKEKFQVILPDRLTLDPPTATNCMGETHTVTATLVDAEGNPISGVTIGFTVTGANPTGGSDDTDANGEATFTYTGTNAGVDSIVAATDSLTSDPVEKIWEPCAPPVPGIAGWGIVAAGVAMAAGAMIALRRTMAQMSR